jgi:hypothetical protein
MKHKRRNWLAVAAFQRSGAGKHKNKALKGSGRKGCRHLKHKQPKQETSA